MPVETFSREDFERALPTDKRTGDKLWEPLGVQEGEYVYRLPVSYPVSITAKAYAVSIIIRSSVRASGVSADSGKDSIRLWLADIQLKPLGSKLSTYITRVAGWDIRLRDQLRTLWRMGIAVGMPCARCGGQRKVFVSKKGQPENRNRKFTRCSQCNFFEWLDHPKTEVQKSEWERKHKRAIIYPVEREVGHP